MLHAHYGAYRFLEHSTCERNDPLAIAGIQDESGKYCPSFIE